MSRTVILSERAYEVLCGLVQPTDQVNITGIYTDVWDELREAFPVEVFLARVPALDEQGDPADPANFDGSHYYDPNAGD